MRLCSFALVAVFSVALFELAPLPAQQKKEAKPADLAIDAKMRTEAIEGALAKLNESYVFPDVAKKMEEAVRDRMAKGEYDNIASAMQFCHVLTAHLREVSKDKHLGMNFSVKALPAPAAKAKAMTQEDREKARELARKAEAFSNFGFEKCERLRGNIGYLDFRKFASPDIAGDTFATAMGFLNNTDALIVDVRQNGGGSAAMVTVMCSYFFDAGQLKHLNDIYDRKSDSTKQFWTLPYLAGKRYVDKELYILTSQRTFSAAEEFAYNLKNLKRATVIGETTGGGAHPAATVRINDHFLIRVPGARSINPITKTNWEGTGVTPDIECPAEHALKIGLLTALQKQAEKTTDPQRLAQLKMNIAATEKEVNDLKKK